MEGVVSPVGGFRGRCWLVPLVGGGSCEGVDGQGQEGKMSCQTPENTESVFFKMFYSMPHAVE